MQILNAAWTCFQREGLHATTMDDIIRACGLSAGAVYSYFKTKDDLILAALTTSLSDLSALLQPVLARDPPPGPDELVAEITAAVEGFSRRDGFDLKRVALLGWSEAQRNERLRASMREFYLAFRQGLVDVAKAWRRSGRIARAADPEDVARTVLSLVLGYVVQAAIVGDVEPDAIRRGLRALAGARGPA
jgi:AcrR family transcriptional regulator